MAERILMKNSNTGIQKDGFYGYSWTTLFFGPFVPLFRADFLTFLGYFAVLVVIGLITAGFGAFLCFIIWSFFYNSYYTKKLLEKGYEFAGNDEENEKAAKVLDVKILKNSSNNTFNNATKKIGNSESNSDLLRNLSDDAYKIYLVKKFPVEFNEVLKKHIFNQKLFDSIDDVLLAMHEIESKTFDDFKKLIETDNEKEAQPYIDVNHKVL
jgi:hypothetical protein